MQNMFHGDQYLTAGSRRPV